MDMGFARQHAVEALIHSNNNMTAATEYVLTRPSLSIPMVSSVCCKTQFIVHTQH